MKVQDAAASSPRDLLVALRETISQAIDEGVPARDLASLSLRLIAIQKEIAVIDAQISEEGDGAADTDDEEWDGEF